MTERHTIFLAIDGRHTTIARDHVGADHDIASHVLAQANGAGIAGYLAHLEGDYHGRGPLIACPAVDFKYAGDMRDFSAAVARFMALRATANA